MFAGMQEMLVNMLKDALPPELMEMLTPEKMQELGDKVTAFVVDVRERLDRIERLTNDNNDKLVQLLIKATSQGADLTVIQKTFREMQNGTNHSGSGESKPKRSGNRKPAAGGDGQ